MGGMNPYAIVQTTTSDEDQAQALAERIVGSRLAACVQYAPVESVYWWQGVMEKAREYRLTAKTRTDLSGRLIAFIRAHHPYEVPEVLVTPIVAGLADYLDWIGKETAPATPEADG